MAHPREGPALWALSGWKAAANHVAAVVVAVLFIVAGAWKITEPFAAAVRLTQALVPGNVSLPAAVLLGVSELLAGVLVLVPRFRRWGAILAVALLLVFMIYIGVFYDRLAGEECNCFPWVKRAVGPGFFVGDGIMLALAVIAGLWARPSSSLRSALLVLLAICVFATVSYGFGAVRMRSVKAPATIQVDGAIFPLREGRVLLFFFDPECLHCAQAARDLAGLSWKDVKVIGAATEQPQFAGDFMRETNLRAPVTTDTAALRKAFPFVSVPYAVALDDGRLVADFRYFDAKEPAETLRRRGFIR